MYKITHEGITVVGNNEDSWRLTSSIWFEPGLNGKYGVAYVGYSDKSLPDGGMNEHGLVFDAFTMYHKKGLKSPDPSRQDFSYSMLPKIMQECKTVDEVYIFLNRLNLHLLNGSILFNGGMLMFADKNGKYLTVEADTLILGNDNKYVLANFSPARTKDLREVKIESYRKGVSFLENKTATNIQFCTALSDTMSVNRKKKGDGTLYTTIYNLNEGLIHAYFFHDYTKRITFNLQEELAKGKHIYHFDELFPDNNAYKKFKKYQVPQNNRLIFWFLIGSMLLFSFAFLYYIFSFFKAVVKKNMEKTAYLKPILALVHIIFVYYLYLLVSNQAIFYFETPYVYKGATIKNITSYLPVLLTIGFVPLVCLNFYLFRSKNWSRTLRFLFTFNNGVFFVLTGLFIYWELVNIF